MRKKLKHMTYMVLKDTGEQSRLNDIVEYIISSLIILNVLLIVVESVDELDAKYGLIIGIFRIGLFIFFLVEYLLRIWIADIVMHDERHPTECRIQHILSFSAIIDFLALMPVLLGGTIIDFRVFRVLRLFRITQLKALRQYTNTLTKVLKLKGTQLLTSLLIVFIFMLTSSVIIYDLEHKVQPEVFKNVLVGLWWSISAITTVGYGDIYPISGAGRALASMISIFGVFIMAIPIGILSAGFFEISKSYDNEKDEEEHNKKNNN